MRLKTAAATAPALQIQTRPPQTRLRAVSGKGAASEQRSREAHGDERLAA